MANVTTLPDAKSVPAAKAALVCPSRNETNSNGRFREHLAEYKLLRRTLRETCCGHGA
ncbi:MAG: hypothetical protein NTY71_07925 [Methanoregula sp.]|jgi:hypothetical protein|nr:hypothetical protein [Methanoregula sp.]